MPRPDPAAGDPPIVEGSPSSVEIADEVEGIADRFGDLRRDPDARVGEYDDLDRDRVRGDRRRDLRGHDLGIQADADPPEDERWFDPEELAAASSVELGDARDLLEHPPALAAIVAEQARPTLSLARLPGWPGSRAAGQGLGDLADAWLGPLGPGDLLLVTGAARGVGRTSLLAQLGDGLALVEGLAGERHSVVFVSPEPPALWRARTLARYFDVEPREFLTRPRPDRAPEFAARLREFAAGSWAPIDARQRFVAPEVLAEPSARAALLDGLRRWQTQLGPGWPVVIVDPIVALGPELVAHLAALARLAAGEGWTVLASADLDERAEVGLARAIDGYASVRLRAAPLDEQRLALELCHRRYGPRGTRSLAWARASGRFEAPEGDGSG
jgi:hypothetical protein